MDTSTESQLNVTIVDEATVPPNLDEPCKLYLFIIYVIIFGSMCVFGLIGNTLSFLVLQWEKKNHVATFLLRVMALVDNFYLITVGFSSIFSALTLFLGYVDNRIQPYIMLIVWPLVYIAQMSTVWSTLLIAINRYIAICKPFQAPFLCTMKKTRIQIAIITIFIIVYNVPRFFEFEIYTHIDDNGHKTLVGKETKLKLSKYYNIIYENVLYCLFYFLGPLVILIVLNACLIRELMMARRRLLARHLPVSGEEEENNLTLVMIVIILVFLICQTPAFLNQLLAYVLPTTAYMCGKPYYYFYHISNVLASANSCLNFVIYCAFRKQFRERMRAFCGICHCKKKSNLMYSAKKYSCDGETVTMYINSSSRNNSQSHILKDNIERKTIKNGSNNI